MKKNLTLVFLGMVSTFIVGVSACSCNETETVQTGSKFVGISEEIAVSVQDSSYDFEQNVKCLSEENEYCEFTVDASKVSFGTVGTYEITYSSGELKQTASVKIYGMPEFEYEPIVLTYAEAVANDALVDKIACKDSFGAILSIEYGALETTNGAVKIGENKITVKATDKAGNVAQEDISVTVQQPVNTIAFDDCSVDFSNATLILEIGERTLRNVWCQGEEVPSEYYVSNNGYLLFTTAFFEKMGVVEEETLYLNFSDCSAEFSLAITDDDEIAYVLNVDHSNAIYMPNVQILAPKATLAEYCIQDVEFRYYLVANENREMVIDNTLNLFAEDTEYRYEIELYKNGKLSKTIEQTFWGSADKYFSQDFANTAMQDYWVSKKTSDGSLSYGEISFGHSITRNGVTKKAIKYYSSYNLGDWGDGYGGVGQPSNLAGMYLSKEVISGAIAAGYNKISFSFTTEKTPADKTLSHRFSVCNHTGAQSAVINGYGNYLYRLADVTANEQWNVVEIALSALTNGTIAFAGWGDTFYLSEVKFLKPTVLDFTKDFASEEMKDYWKYYGEQASITYETGVTMNGTAKDAIKLYGANHTADFNSTNLYLSGFYLDPTVLAQLKTEGYTKMTIEYSFLQDSAGTGDKYRAYIVADYAGTGNIIQHGNVINVTTTPMHSNATAESWNTLTYDFSQIEDGKTFAICWWMQTMYISSITFSKA